MKKIRKLTIMVLVLAMALSLFAATASAAGTVAYGAATVTASKLNIRSGPGTSYSVAGSVAKNARVVVLEQTTSSWYQINYQGTVGYVSASYLKDVLKTENFTATGTVTGNGVRMRSKPNTSSSVVGSYKSGTKMTVTGINNGWYKVQYNGKAGYLRSDFMNITGGASANTGSSVTLGTSNVTLGGALTSGANDALKSTVSANDELRAEIVSFAKKYNGYRYVYGGTSPSGFDCSGFIYYIFKLTYGYNMSRTASAQYANNGTKVSKSDLKPGDIVFFSDDGRGVTHVGLYIGDGQFIHAANSRKGVIINDLFTGYWAGVYWGAKNVIG
ncbi:MAG: SH3 domain-containing protein [Oscillospiraceae bacterium]|nr:SH3 domain-containing protein [Oscillospiraceae bacterium]